MVNLSEEELQALIDYTAGVSPWDDDTHEDHKVANAAREKLVRAQRRDRQDTGVERSEGSNR